MARGDRLAVLRRLPRAGLAYTHLGVDLGDGTVVHAQPTDPARLFAGGRVVRTSLETFAGGQPVRRIHDPVAVYPADEIARRAAEAVGRAGYCPVGDNCEHFVSWCATGERTSRQSAILLGRAGAAATRVAAVIAARLAAGTGERLLVRTALGTTARFGLRTLVPAVVVAEGAALAAEWTAHQRGAAGERCRRAGEAAGMMTSAGICAVAAAAAGPAAMATAALAGAAVWAGGTAALVAVDRLRQRSAHGMATDPPRGDQ